MTINAATLAQQCKAVGLSASIAATELDQTLRHTQRTLNGKHPTPSLQVLGNEWFTDYATALRVMLSTIEEQPAGTILLRSFDQSDDISDIISPHWADWNGARYNKLVQTILVLDELGIVGRNPDTTLMVLENKHWTSDTLISHLGPDIATYAVAFRTTTAPLIKLCRHRFDTEPAGTAEYFTDLHIVDTIAPAHALDDDEVSNSGLWKLAAATGLLNTHGFKVVEDWSVLGRGTPMGITTVLPAVL